MRGLVSARVLTSSFWLLQGFCSRIESHSIWKTGMLAADSSRLRTGRMMAMKYGATSSSLTFTRDEFSAQEVL